LTTVAALSEMVSMVVPLGLVERTNNAPPPGWVHAS
jgi:hypothetical protein